MNGFPHQLMLSDAPTAFTSTSVSITTPSISCTAQVTGKLFENLQSFGLLAFSVRNCNPQSSESLSVMQRLWSRVPNNFLNIWIMCGRVWVSNRFLSCWFFFFSVFSSNSHWIMPLLPSGGPFCVEMHHYSVDWTESLSKQSWIVHLRLVQLELFFIRSSQLTCALSIYIFRIYNSCTNCFKNIK